MKNTGLADSPFFKESIKKNTNVRKYQDIKVSCNHKPMVSSIKKRINDVGREAATYRLTDCEKFDLAKIIYEYKLQKIKITENTIIRIGLNYLLQDKLLKKNNSILHKVISSFR